MCWICSTWGAIVPVCCGFLLWQERGGKQVWGGISRLRQSQGPGGCELVEHSWGGASPMVGKLVGIIWRARQACLDRQNRSVDSVKYTICLVDRVSPAGVSPHSRSTKAPAMSIPLLLVVVIFIETGRRSCFCRPNFPNRAVPARHDWHPVSAMAETSTVLLDLGIWEGILRAFMSVGSAWTRMPIMGWGSEARLSHILHSSLYTWWSRVIAQVSAVGWDTSHWVWSLIVHKVWNTAVAPSWVRGAAVKVDFRCDLRHTVSWWCSVPHLAHVWLYAGHLLIRSCLLWLCPVFPQ